MHVFQSFPFLESSGVAFRSIAKFVQNLQSTTSDSFPGHKGPIPQIHATEQDKSVRSEESRSTSPVDEDAVASEMAHGETKLVKSDGTEVDIARTKDDDEVEDGNDKAEQVLQDTLDKEEEEEEQKDSLSPLVKSTLTLPTMLDDQEEGEKQQRQEYTNSNFVESSDDTPAALEFAPTTPQKPFMRRALSGFVRTRPESPQLVRRISGSSFFSFSAVRPTTPIVSKQDQQQQHPPPSPSAEHVTLPSSPSWPHSSVRGHRPTISHHLTRSPVIPTTRARSQSHSDMISLVNGYSQRGAANSTVVYSPGPVKATALAPDDAEVHNAPLDLDTQTNNGNMPGGLGLLTHG